MHLGVTLNGKSVFEYGDISICSLHATKLYHSVEGGLLITKDPALLKKLAYMRNFGFDGPEAFAELGINGKNSELHAAMGLVNLDHIEEIIAKRKLLTDQYHKMLKNINAFIPECGMCGCKSNYYGYYPVVFES